MHIKAILNGVIVSCEDGNYLTLTFLMVGFDTILCSLNGVKFKAMTFTETVAVNDRKKLELPTLVNKMCVKFSL